jgi:hypothetical protein
LQQASWPSVRSADDSEDLQLAVDSIVVHKIPLERAYARKEDPLQLPCIIITPPRLTASATAGVNTSDDYGKPCLVTMVMSDRQEPTLQLNLSPMSMWQQIVMRAFQNQRLPGVSEVVICHVEPAEAVIPVAWGRQVLASAVLLRFTSREPRGLTT